MKKSITKITALCLCALLAARGNAATAFAAADDAGISKDETVYVLAGADGSAQKIIVSDWIKNASGNAAVNDKTELTDIENVKGEETCTMNDDNTLVWDAQGNDIYYQGSTEKELPVDLSVTYKLDGEPITADELAGKSGRVTIRFDYQNKQYETVEIDGEQENIYVPFAMLTGVFLDNDVFTNIEVSNGKLIDDGARTAVIGIAFPGLQEDLAIPEDKLEIPDYVEISADASDFKLDMTATLATNELWNELDTDGLDSVSELSESTGDLTDAMDQLLDGSSQLYEGLAALLEKSGELTEGINQLATGAESLTSGAGSLDSGAAAIQTGALQLSDGLNTLAMNNDTLNTGAKQVFDTLLSTADAQLVAAGLNVPTLTMDNYAQVLNEVQEQLAAVSEEAAEPVAALKSSLDSYNEFYLGLQSYTAGVADAAAGAGTLKTGADDLKTGTSQLNTGASELYNGILALQNGTPALTEGITQLRDGAMQLSSGLQEFNEQGIQKLVDAVDGDLNSFVTRFRATRDVSLRYENFAGAGEDMECQVQFIYRTDAVE